MKKIAIIYHSGYGHTEKVAKHVLKGANSVENIKADIFNTEDIKDNLERIDDYDAFIFGSPTYMGSVSAKFKEFMEKSSSRWAKQQWKNKIAAGFSNSHSLSGDKLNSLFQLVIFAMQHSMIWVGQGELNQSPDDNPGKSDAINRVGSYLGVMTQSDNKPAEETPLSGDLQTAEKLGKRVGEYLISIK